MLAIKTRTIYVYVYIFAEPNLAEEKRKTGSENNEEFIALVAKRSERRTE